jgi:hypothetical protein
MTPSIHQAESLRDITVYALSGLGGYGRNTFHRVLLVVKSSSICQRFLYINATCFVVITKITFEQVTTKDLLYYFFSRQ